MTARYLLTLPAVLFFAPVVAMAADSCDEARANLASARVAVRNCLATGAGCEAQLQLLEDAERAVAPCPQPCARDVECKGDRICVDGKCVDPPASPTPASMGTATPAVVATPAVPSATDNCNVKRDAERAAQAAWQAAAVAALQECIKTGKGCESEFARRNADKAAETAWHNAAASALNACITTGWGCEKEFATRNAAVAAAKGCPAALSPAGTSPVPTAAAAAPPIPAAPILARRAPAADVLPDWQRRPGSFTGEIWLGFSYLSFDSTETFADPLTGTGLGVGANAGFNVSRRIALLVLGQYSGANVQYDISASDRYVQAGLLYRGRLSTATANMMFGVGYSVASFQSPRDPVTGATVVTVVDGFGYSLHFEFVFARYLAVGIRTSTGYVDKNRMQTLSFGATVGVSF